jgi:hypothetical protein
MTYIKPEVAVLGSADTLIEQVSGKVTPNIDGTPHFATPAYDLDE